MTNYIRSFSAGDILRSSLTIYWNNLTTFSAIYVLPMLPFLIIQAVAELLEDRLLVALITLFSVAVSLLVTAGITVAVSDVCLGHQPDVARSYRRAFSEMPGKVVGTSLLLWVIIVLGLVLLVVPGLIFSLWYLFAIPVVVLERVGGMAALRRSRELGKGLYMRNVGVYLLLFVTFFTPAYILGFGGGFLIGYSGEIMGYTDNQTLAASLLFGRILGTFLAPILVVGMVLLYYDMRVRKEAYNVQALADELRR
jgi:hypothetical protein